MRRFAVYFVPPQGSPLAEFGADWLGRDPYTGELRLQPRVPAIEPGRLQTITASPRLYGFHATMKAPFELSPRHAPSELHTTLAELAARTRPFTIDLVLGSLGGFLALVPRQPNPTLDELAAACVMELDHLRAPPAAADLARRRQAKLSEREHDYLLRYGYPYVLEFFEFHMTLTERLVEPEHSLLRGALAPLVARFCGQPLAIDAPAIFEQSDRSSPFTVIARYPLAG